MRTRLIVLCILLGCLVVVGFVELGYELGKRDEGRRRDEMAQAPDVPWSEWTAGTPQAMTEPPAEAFFEEPQEAVEEPAPPQPEGSYQKCSA